jgi:mono/diheme cytochrome c family protein
MKRTRMVALLGLLIGAWLLDDANAIRAACRVKTEVVAANVVAVPVAVSVGVPVAQVAPYYYSYQAFVPQSAALAANDVAVEAIAARVVEKLRPPSTGTAAPSTQASPPLTLVAQKCAKCHGGGEPKGNLSLENLGLLDCNTRLRAVRAVLSEKMPKGGPRLTPDEAGKVLDELTRGSE